MTVGRNVPQFLRNNTFSFGNNSLVPAMQVHAIGTKSNGQTNFISCCTEKSFPYLSAIDFNRNMMRKIVNCQFFVCCQIATGAFIFRCIFKWAVGCVIVYHQKKLFCLHCDWRTNVNPEPCISYGIPLEDICWIRQDALVFLSQSIVSNTINDVALPMMYGLSPSALIIFSLFWWMSLYLIVVDPRISPR